jgi:2-haloacid dehalogenase
VKQRYQVLLLDADGTLFDFGQAERQAYDQTAKHCGLPREEEAYHLYSNINEKLWKMLERGEIAKKDLVVRRFADLLETLNLQGDAVAISETYRHHLGQGAFLLPGAEELCRNLAPVCRLIIASNGVTSIQKSRLARSAIAPYIEALVVSESGGADKPDLRFFTYLDEKVGPLDKSTTLMVGDRLEADILGGMRFGVDTCWYNPHGKAPLGDIQPTYTIRTLEELSQIVLA